jgi:hypothetical protein
VLPASTQGKRMLIYGDGTDIRAGSSAIGANYSEFASATAMLFVQTSAPLGWTKSTTHNNKALRIVSGAAGSGGSDAFTSVFGIKSTNGFTLTTNEMPSHSHNFTGRDNIGSTSKPAAAIDPQDLLTYTTQGTGGGGAHAHTIPTIDLAYVDVDHRDEGLTWPRNFARFQGKTASAASASSTTARSMSTSSANTRRPERTTTDWAVPSASFRCCWSKTPTRHANSRRLSKPRGTPIGRTRRQWRVAPLRSRIRSARQRKPCGHAPSGR